MALEPVIPGGTPQPGAPTDAPYLIQTADGRLANAQALAALGPGLLKTGTGGAVAIAEPGTDYAVPNGGGGPAFPVQPAPRLSASVWGSAALLFAGPFGAVTAFAGSYQTQPVPLAAAMHCQEIGIHVLTPASAGATARLAIWADDDPGGGPATLLFDAGEVPLDAAGWQSAPVDLDLGPGLVWASRLPGADAGLLGLTAIHLPIFGVGGDGTDWVPFVGYDSPGGEDPADPYPDAYPTRALAAGGNAALVWLRWQS
jgi:hypothetical protein